MSANIVEVKISEQFYAKVCLFGATVTSWVDDGKERLYLSSLSKMDGRKAVRGGIPIVFPNFGPWECGPQHGFARVSWWTLISNEKIEEGVTKAVFALEENETTLAMWNHKFKLLYEVEIRPGALKTSLTVFNTGDQFDFTVLLHSYFSVSDIENCAISGFEGLSYDDKISKECGKIEKRQEIKISDNVDSVYSNTKVHVLKSPLSEIRIEKFNLPDTVVWNPWSAKAKDMSDFEDDDYRRMVCVEPGFVANRKVLATGEQFLCSQTLSTKYGRKTSL